MAKIKILTDSAADIPAEFLSTLPIEVVPFPITAGEREILDRETVSPQEFYKILDEEAQIPTHAQITPYQFGKLYEKAWREGYTHLIYVAINSRGSNTYQNALQQATSFFYEFGAAKGEIEITVIDSKSYTLAYGYAVIEGAKMAEAGASAEEVIAFIQDWIDHARILFVPFNLKHAKKSGRVSAASSFVGEALGLKPVLTFEDGKSSTITKVRGEKNVNATLLELIEDDRVEASPYCILRTTLPTQEEALIALLTKELGMPPAMETYIGGVISINAGSSLLGVVYREESDDDEDDEDDEDDDEDDEDD